MSSKQKVILALVLLEIIQLLVFFKLSKSPNAIEKGSTEVQQVTVEPALFKTIGEDFEQTTSFGPIDSAAVANNSSKYVHLTEGHEWGPTWSLDAAEFAGTRKIVFKTHLHSNNVGNNLLVLNIQDDKGENIHYSFIWIPIQKVNEGENWFEYNGVIEVPGDVNWDAATKLNLYVHNRNKLDFSIDNVYIDFMK